MTQKERYEKVMAWFEAERPLAESELHFGSTFQMLVAVVLSAQCTDKRVNMVTPALFATYPDAAAMATAQPNEVLRYIASVSYPNSKSKHLVELARRIVNVYGGEVPDTMDDLLTLPGVGRKTANVVQAIAWNRPAMPVDTHVFRVANRIGLTNNSRTPLQTERTLVRNIPAEKIPRAHHWLILHGRYVCQARKPKCDECGLTALCRHYSKSHSTKTTATS
ncbi:MAG: endonuclease III [Bacteroidales bacterium]|nr:endonuclease III [Bacteroidales bacterium]